MQKYQCPNCGSTDVELVRNPAGEVVAAVCHNCGQCGWDSDREPIVSRS